MNELRISWEEYHKKTEELAIKVYDDGWNFNQVVCIAKGGMRVGDIFARLFRVPLAILSVESYKGETTKNKRGAITFSRDLAKTTPNIGSKILLVDDLADSGITLKKSIEWLEHFYGFYLEEPVRTGVLFYKSVSTFKPDYYVDYLKDSPWIHMPFERYEEITIEDLKNK
ncbi:MAG: Xanthine phosphoribosyltransferase [Alphaproteobacteria bacterium MarineAlpha5_Bin9]|nr:MAG: Xanthine phosphoribosyltransferase [Alphaproteobacteria bacterium MarineAlpha5_Bin9]|tara:strand:+ start:2786 stop:3295 length:510 start_codon:yes stop_codon:yes gene_type:complete